MIDQDDRLARRLDRYRSAVRRSGDAAPDHVARRPPEMPLAERLAEAIGGEVRVSTSGSVVWCKSPPHSIPIDRSRLAALPGQPPAGVPLVCLDTETTGLATAAGTVAFLVGLGWWEGDEFHQVQLLVPDHADEPAMLAALRGLIPPDAWLVTYNGRAFDWPLLVARYRLHGSPAPAHAGHLDLLPVVRRLFRHRMPDARLRSAEEHLLGVRRHGDVEGWEIPGRYLGFLHGGSGRAARSRRPAQRPGRPLARTTARSPRARPRRPAHLATKPSRATWPDSRGRSPDRGGWRKRSHASTSRPRCPFRRYLWPSTGSRRRNTTGGHRGSSPTTEPGSSTMTGRGDRNEPGPGRSSGSRSSRLDSNDARATTGRRLDHGHRSWITRDAPASSPPSNWPSSTSTVSATWPRRPRSRRPGSGGPTDGDASAIRSPPWRTISADASPGSVGDWHERPDLTNDAPRAVRLARRPRPYSRRPASRASA